MFNPERVRPVHYSYPILALLAASFIAIKGWGILATVMIIFAVLHTIVLIAKDLIYERRLLLMDSIDHLQAQIKLHEVQSGLGPEEKAEAGLIPVPTQTPISIIHRKSDGQMYRMQFPIVSISPVKLQRLAHGFQNGQVFSLREISGAGKLLTDTEARRLQVELKEFGLIAYRSEKNHNLGFNWTEAGLHFIKAWSEE